MSADARRIKELFVAALDLPDAVARRGFLDSACAADAELRQRLNVLLQAHDAPASVLERPLATVDMSTPPDSAGTLLADRYKLLERIGEGGMGEVWMAQQTEPVRRLVAVKLIKPGMDSKQILARFEQERQALALMDHPNIARVLDAGSTPDGRPFFVMELVKGKPITQFCDEHRLTPRDRLELLVPVCQAIQHAHQKGIIHRDIKPSNVLIALYDEKPVPKVIDFGVAKATGQQLTEQTLHTNFGAVVGTLEYMSPEQAGFNQLDIDTRSDIYSLGVLLYELLTGSPPFTCKEQKDAGMLEMLRVIREQEPSKPSNKLSTGEGLPTLAANRSTEPGRLTKLVRGELDWIALKALEKDRNRRYETALSFALDVKRYLADEPVVACPPSTAYRLRKFTRRHKGAMIAATLLGGMLLMMAGGVGWMASDRAGRRSTINFAVTSALQDATTARERALELTDDPSRWDAALAEALSALKRAEGLTAQDEDALSDDVSRRFETLRALLEADRTDRRFIARFDEIRAEQTAVNEAVSEFKREVAYPAFKDAFQNIYAVSYGTTEPEQVVRLLEQRPRAIREYLWAALQMSLTHAPKDNSQVRHWLMSVLESHNADPWRKQARTAVKANDWSTIARLIREGIAARQPSVVLISLAERLPREAPRTLEVWREIRRGYPSDFWANHSFANILHYRQQPRLEEAIRYYAAALAIRPRNSAAAVNLGNALRSKGELDEAIAVYRHAVAMSSEYGAAHAALGEALAAKGQWDESIAAYREAIRHRQFTGDHYALGKMLCERKGDYDAAIVVFKEAIRLTPEYANCHSNLGVALTFRGQVDEGIAAFKKAIELKQDFAEPHGGLGSLYTHKGDYDAAIASYKEAIRLKPDFFQSLYGLGLVLAKHKNDYAGAIPIFRQAIQAKPNDCSAHAGLGYVLWQTGDHKGANDAFRSAMHFSTGSDRRGKAAWWFNRLAWRLATSADTQKRDPHRAVELARDAVQLDPREGAYWNTLGTACFRAGKDTEAITALQQSIKLGGGSALDWFILAMAHWKQGNKDEARKWYDRAIEWMKMHASNNEELRRFRAEAAELMRLEPKKD